MDEERLHELFASLAAVEVKRMFGGQAVYSEGTIVAVVVGDDVMIKADGVTAPLFAAAGSVQWTYERAGRSAVRMPYWRLPDDAQDDPDAMAAWASRAVEAAARQTATSKSKTKRASKPSKRKRVGS